MLLPLVAPVGIAPAGAAEAFTLTVNNGELLLRDAVEPYVLESPTTFSGTNDGGVLKDMTFATPPIDFVLEVTNPISTTAEIHAVFTQVGAATGAIDPDGNVTLTLRLTVDLGIYVPILLNTFQCRATPVVLTLRSEGTYDGSGVLSAGFSVPSTPTTDTCTPIISGAVNAALLGGGHLLRLPVSGELTRPAHPGEPTTTSLVVSPTSSGMGDLVTLTATVAKGPGTTGTEPLTGGVDFLDRGRVVGTAELDESGKAEVTLDNLGAGDRRLQARYQGIPEVWASSTSAVVEHRVNATPFLSAVVPATVRSGGAPASLAVTVDNTTLGAPLEDVRVDVSIRRVPGNGTGAIGPVSGVPRITLTHVDGDTETPIELAGTSVLTGTIGGATGWDLAAGASRTDDLRLAVSDNTNQGPLQITFSLVRVTPGTGEAVLATLATGSDQIVITKATRATTTVTAGDVFFDPPIVPLVVRQGGYLNVNQLAVSAATGVAKTGTFEFFIDGQTVVARQLIVPNNSPYSQVVPVSSFSNTYLVQVPVNMPIGAKQVTVRYSGDVLHAPSQESWPVQVAPGAGASYECVWTGAALAYRAFLNVQATAALPALAAGGQVDVTDLELRILAPRTSTGLSGYAFIGGSLPSLATIFFSSGGEATSTSATRVNGTPMTTTSGSPDHLITFTDTAGQVELSGEPGEQIPVIIDRITIYSTNNSTANTITCVPVNDPVVLGQVTLAATTLATDAATVETGTAVALSAASLPAGAGAVEFRDGTTSIGVVPTSDGNAVHLADNLAPGVHELTAIFHGGPGRPKTTSEPVRVRVATCATATGEGNEAAVRLMYLEILRRCPDAAGLAYWVERLDAGATTREQITVQLASSLEARKVYVDDAYRQMLGRPAERAGRDYWAPRLAMGRYDVLLGDLAASAEFRALAGGTDAGVVQRIYERIIGRAAEPDGVTYWTTYMRTHGVSRLVQVLYNLPEPLAATVRNAYQGLIGRAPTSQEATAGANLLASTGNRGRLDGAIIATDDFDTRAQGIPELT